MITRIHVFDGFPGTNCSGNFRVVEYNEYGRIQRMFGGQFEYPWWHENHWPESERLVIRNRKRVALVIMTLGFIGLAIQHSSVMFNG